MRDSPWIGVALGTVFLTVAAYEVFSGRAFSKYSVILKRDAPRGYWTVVAVTFALGAYTLFVSFKDLTTRG